MARIRTVKPEFPQSESMGRVSREARLLFVLLWTIADDFGKCRGNSRALASLLYPYDDDAPKLIDGWLSELEEETCILQYEVDGNHYLKILNWSEHQKVDHPSRSKFPDPTDDFDEPREPSRNPRSGPKDQGPKDQGAEDAREERAKEDDAPLPNKPETISPETETAVRFIASFDACQESVFGALKRQTPHGSDLGTALRWVRSGLTLEFCEPFFLAKFRDLKAQNRTAPTTLSYLTNALAEAKAASELPMPKVSDDELVRSIPNHLRSRKTPVPAQHAVGSPKWQEQQRRLMGQA